MKILLHQSKGKGAGNWEIISLPKTYHKYDEEGKIESYVVKKSTLIDVGSKELKTIKLSNLLKDGI